jgi:hypothetical protein
MKASLFLFLISFSTLVFTGCEKDCEQPDPQPITPPTKTEQLSTHTWIYDEFYTNWQQPTQALAYKKGGTSNTINYAPNRVKFFRDGSFEETMNTGAFRAGIWQFQNNQTVLATGSASYSNTVTIIKLTADSLVWHDAINKTYAIQLAKK